MDGSPSNFSFVENYYSLTQLSQFNNNDASPLTFPSQIIDEAPTLEGSEGCAFSKRHEQTAPSRGDARSTGEIKCEPIKSELSEVSSNQNMHQLRVPTSGNIPGPTCTSVNKHVPTNGRPKPDLFKCDLCPFLSLSQSRLNAHNSQGHSPDNINKLNCPGCENSFYVSRSLQAHLMHDHHMTEQEANLLVSKVVSATETVENRKSRIYLKNVDCLRNPPAETTLPQEEHQDVDLIDLINDDPEDSHNSQQSGVSFRNEDILEEVIESSEDVNSNGVIKAPYNVTQNDSMGTIFMSDFRSDLGTLTPAPKGVERRGRPKIYIKNVDILKEPIFVPTNNFTNVLSVNADISTLALFPSSTNGSFQESNSLLGPPQTSLTDQGVDSSHKIFIRNEELLKKQALQDTPKKASNSLHLRTVDELNLMNKNEVQNLFTPVLDQNCLNEINNLSSENSKNSDEVRMPSYITPSEFNYTQSSNFIGGEADVIQMNWTNDYGFDSLENIMDSSSSVASAEQKNPHFDLNTPQRSISDEHDKDMLFVCAQEIVNASSSEIESEYINEDIEAEKQSDLNLYMSTSLPHIEEQEVVEILDDLEKQHPTDASVSAIPEKGRIYVADNLMKDDKTRDEAKRKVRGRPLGSKRTWVTMIKSKNNKTAGDLGFKCDQNCGMRFLKQETLDIHKQCHIELSSQRMKCPACESTNFSSWDTLHTHLWRIHQIDMDLYSCQHCDFKTPILSRLINTHSKIHSEERNFKCEQCSKLFKNSKQLKNHRRTHRSNSTITEIHRCETCGSAFSQIKSLRGHICREKVRDRELFSCTVCGKVVSNKSSLKQHLLTHQDAKKYKCDQCTYVTNDHNSFRRHKLTHDKAKMYSCKFCDYKCIQSNVYQKHVIKDHPECADQVIFRCPTCSFSTINKAKYTLHIAKHGDAVIHVDSQLNNTTLRTGWVAATCNNPQAENAFSTKIKVKSNLVLTDPAKFAGINSNLLEITTDDLT